jgi:hypothetical protein
MSSFPLSLSCFPSISLSVSLSLSVCLCVSVNAENRVLEVQLGPRAGD